MRPKSSSPQARQIFASSVVVSSTRSRALISVRVVPIVDMLLGADWLHSRHQASGHGIGSRSALEPAVSDPGTPDGRRRFRMLVAGSDVGSMVQVRLEVAGPLGQDRSREFLERMGFREHPDVGVLGEARTPPRRPRRRCAT